MEVFIIVLLVLRSSQKNHQTRLYKLHLMCEELSPHTVNVIDNEARISKKAEIKRKFNRNQKRITP